jgi:hypothetical protein
MAIIALTEFAADHGGVIRSAYLNPALQGRHPVTVRLAHAMLDTPDTAQDLQELFEQAEDQRSEERIVQLALSWIGLTEPAWTLHENSRRNPRRMPAGVTEFFVDVIEEQKLGDRALALCVGALARARVADQGLSNTLQRIATDPGTPPRALLPIAAIGDPAIVQELLRKKQPHSVDTVLASAVGFLHHIPEYTSFFIERVFQTNGDREEALIALGLRGRRLRPERAGSHSRAGRESLEIRQFLLSELKEGREFAALALALLGENAPSETREQIGRALSKSLSNKSSDPAALATALGVLRYRPARRALLTLLSTTAEGFEGDLRRLGYRNGPSLSYLAWAVHRIPSLSDLSQEDDPVQIEFRKPIAAAFEHSTNPELMTAAFLKRRDEWVRRFRMYSDFPGWDYPAQGPLFTVLAGSAALHRPTP